MEEGEGVLPTGNMHACMRASIHASFITTATIGSTRKSSERIAGRRVRGGGGETPLTGVGEDDDGGTAGSGSGA